MDVTNLAVLIVAAAAVVLVAALIPMILQLKKTLASTDVFIKNLDSSLNPLIEDDIRPMVKTINGTVGELEGVARVAREGAEKVDDTLDALHEVGDAVRTINHIINSRIKTSVIEVAAYVVGVKAALESLVEIIKRRSQKEV